jgi:hypothetical protein
MINIEKNYKKSEYLIAYAIFIILGLNYFLLNLMHVDRYIVEINRYICLFIIILNLIFKKFMLNKFLFLFLFLFGFASNGNSLLMGFYFSVIISLVFYNLSSMRLLKIQLRCLNFIFLIWVFLLISGILINEFSLDYYAAQIGEIHLERLRYSLGFGNPNEAASIVTSFVLMGFVASSNRMLPFIFYLATSIIVYFYTDSRALILAVIFFILFKHFYNFNFKNSNLLKLFTLAVLLAPFLITIASGLIIIEYPLLDVLFSYRLVRVSNYFLEFSTFNILFGGASIPLVAIDNSFALLMGIGGISLSLLVIFFAYRAALSCNNGNRANLYAFILSFWCYSFFESSMLRPELLAGLIFWHLLAVGCSAKIAES